MGRQYKQLYQEFLSNVNKRKVGTVLPEEFAMLFNLAVEEVYTNKLSVMDVNKKINTDLNTFIDSQSGNMTVDITGAYRCFTMTPSNAIRRVKSIRLLLDNKFNAKCVEIKANRRSSILDSVYDSPTVQKCYYELANGKIVAYVPKITNAVKAYIEYYKEVTPVTDSTVISVGVCPYTSEMCTEIVNAASRLCIERNQDGRYQSFAVDLKNKQTNQ